MLTARINFAITLGNAKHTVEGVLQEVIRMKVRSCVANDTCDKAHNTYACKGGGAYERTYQIA